MNTIKKVEQTWFKFYAVVDYTKFNRNNKPQCIQSINLYQNKEDFFKKENIPESCVRGIRAVPIDIVVDQVENLSQESEGFNVEEALICPVCKEHGSCNCKEESYEQNIQG